MSEINPELLVRFWSKVTQTDNCWIWGGMKTTLGYGTMKIQRKKIYAHRISYKIFKGEIPEGLVIDHLCRNRLCVNPEHLEAVTLKQNILRGDNFTAKEARQTHCKNGHELKEPNLIRYFLKKGHRNCRICWNINQNIYHKEKRKYHDYRYSQ